MGYDNSMGVALDGPPPSCSLLWGPFRPKVDPRLRRQKPMITSSYSTKIIVSIGFLSPLMVKRRNLNESHHSSPRWRYGHSVLSTFLGVLSNTEMVTINAHLPVGEGSGSQHVAKVLKNVQFGGLNEVEIGHLSSIPNRNKNMSFQVELKPPPRYPHQKGPFRSPLSANAQIFQRGLVHERRVCCIHLSGQIAISYVHPHNAIPQDFLFKFISRKSRQQKILEMRQMLRP